MVLEALAALSVASSVVQFVDFGTKLISKGKEFYQSADGVLTDHAEQAAISSRLAELSKRLSDSVSFLTTGKKLSPGEEALLEVVVECMKSANDFTDAIHDLRVTGSH